MVQFAAILLLALVSATYAANPDPRAVYAWFAGDSGLQLSADKYSVSGWANQGLLGTNNSCTQSSRSLVNLTGEPQAIYLRSPAGEALKAIRFSGADGIWAAKSTFGLVAGNRTVFVCARVNDNSAKGYLFDCSSLTPGCTRALAEAGSWRVSTSLGDGQPTTRVMTNKWQVHAFVVTTNSAGARVAHYIDGATVGEVALPTPGAISGLIVGANVAQQSGIRADVAEMLVYSSALESEARTQVEGYLADKWLNAVPDPNAPQRPQTSQFVPVFVGGEGGYGCYRIPAMVSSKKGTILAVADGRISGCGDIPNPLDLVLRRSFDNGKTWGPLQVIANYGSDPNDQDIYPYYGITNPIPRVSSGDAALLLDRQNSRIWVLYDNGGMSGGRKIKLEMRYSDDDGATWSGALDIERLNPGLRPARGGEFLAGPGNGVQVEFGPHAGRLVFPVYIYGNPSSSMVIYSDDHGATWKRGGVAGLGGGEIQVAETLGGGLLASMRDNNFPTSGVRTFSRSTDSGLTWQPVYTSTSEQPGLPDPANQGSILRLTTTNDSNRSRLVFANAADPTTRIKMTLRMSYDEGRTWPVADLIYAGSSAYSALCKTADGRVGLLFERANYTRIDFVLRSVSAITGGADKSPPYTAWAGERFTPAQLAELDISGPAADPDGDRFDNYAEFLAGTDPMNDVSALRLEAQFVSTSALMLHFQADSNRSYSILHRADLLPGGWQPFAEVAAVSSNSLVQLWASPTGHTGFFRIRTSEPQDAESDSPTGPNDFALFQ